MCGATDQPARLLSQSDFLQHVGADWNYAPTCSRSMISSMREALNVGLLKYLGANMAFSAGPTLPR